ncbi:O-antigen ligase-like membrane protein [Novosphingobium sp. PhB165]|uniref:O-antigen ligase family protein n=1 Tax=Novosphingobium sp. PhB165 TaxID=2485105 RepID=UPI0010DEFEF2|nr:O-antigen ligase family protein [Novosphingobium sp. PhB165]TCM20529.1 O-antigen ligase-like membrane protein [Novosphingobium sp. PhB165]
MLALTAGSPPLPAYIVLPALMVYLVLILLLAMRASASTSFLVATFGIRLAMSAQPHFSYSSSPAGLSWNALASVLIVVTGSLLLHRTRAVPLILIPIIPLTLVVIASLLLNKDVSGGIESLVKYAFFATIALTAYDAFVADGPGKVLSRLVFTFTLPLVLQCASLVLHIAKATESDGSASYIGGYNHEASFSIILLTGLLIALLHPALRSSYKLGIAAVCVGGILAANYRTAIIAAAPLLLGLIMAAILSAVPPRQRPVAGILGVLLVLSVVPVIPKLAGDRFDAVTVVADDPDVLTKAPDEFRKTDRALMSGRLFLWSEYIDDWRHGTKRQHVLGFGANSWEGRYRYYAHNTLISTLYELGTLGVASMLLLWSWMFVIALSTAGSVRMTLVIAHLSFFILNMATMPFWMIEGILFYGLLCGFTVYSRLNPPPRPQPVANGLRPRPV